jgi:hypothetical protein
MSRSEPDYYTLKMTKDFIEQLLTEYNSRHGIKKEGKII